MVELSKLRSENNIKHTSSPDSPLDDMNDSWFPQHIAVNEKDMDRCSSRSLNILRDLVKNLPKSGAYEIEYKNNNRHYDMHYIRQ